MLASDPEANGTAARVRPELTFVDTAAEAVVDADAVLVLTEWKQYRELVPADLAAASGRIILDGRNCLDRDLWRDAGWHYRSLGRP